MDIRGGPISEVERDRVSDCNERALSGALPITRHSPDDVTSATSVLFRLEHDSAVSVARARYSADATNSGSVSHGLRRFNKLRDTEDGCSHHDYDHETSEGASNSATT